MIVKYLAENVCALLFFKVIKDNLGDQYDQSSKRGSNADSMAGSFEYTFLRLYHRYPNIVFAIEYPII